MKNVSSIRNLMNSVMVVAGKNRSSHMKMLSKKRLFGMVLFLAATSPSSWAGREAGGGHAVRVGDETYLFDFFEGGIESSVSLSEQCRVSNELLNQVSSTLNIDERMGRQIACKIEEVRRVSPAVASGLTRIMLSYQWQVIQPELFKQYDIGRSPIKNTSGGKIPLIQAALRYDDTKIVYIDRSVWSSLPESHRVGLVFHEIIFAAYSQRFWALYSKGKHPAYGISIVFRNWDSKSGDYCEQVAPDSAASRGMNTYFFSRAFSVASPEGFTEKWKRFMKQAETTYSVVDYCAN
jgi:hypothetical protein